MELVRVITAKEAYQLVKSDNQTRAFVYDKIYDACKKDELNTTIITIGSLSEEIQTELKTNGYQLTEVPPMYERSKSYMYLIDWSEAK